MEKNQLLRLDTIEDLRRVLMEYIYTESSNNDNSFEDFADRNTTEVLCSLIVALHKSLD